MKDIAPELLQKVQTEFQKQIDASEKIKKFYEKVRDGTATYKDANEFAIEVGEALSASFGKHISSDMLPDGKMYFNIADRVVRIPLENNYEIAADAATEVQGLLNQSAGIGIKAVKPEMNKDKVQGIINIVSGNENYDDIAYMLGEPIVNFTQTVIDDAVRANADFQSKSGLSPKIVRKSTGNCCEWCERLAGVYNYEDVSDTGNDVFRRHKNCRCTVEYDPGDGTKQDVWSKKWSESGKSDKIKKETPKEREIRVINDNGLGLAYRIATHPRMLAAYTPKGLKKALENAGYDVEPLAKGNLEGITFEEGGGFKVNFGGDGIIQYHPKKGSHHGGEYYKVSTGKIGRKRYDMNGDEIDVEKN